MEVEFTTCLACGFHGHPKSRPYETEVSSTWDLKGSQRGHFEDPGSVFVPWPISTIRARSAHDPSKIRTRRWCRSMLPFNGQTGSVPAGDRVRRLRRRRGPGTPRTGRVVGGAAGGRSSARCPLLVRFFFLLGQKLWLSPHRMKQTTATRLIQNIK